jgi:hypothetical protein
MNPYNAKTYEKGVMFAVSRLSKEINLDIYF